MQDVKVISLPAIASLILAFIALLVWKELYQYHCIALVIPAIVILIISLNSRRLAIQRRSCLANCYFCKTSLISKIYHGKTTVTILTFLTSIISGSFLMLDLITWDSRIMLLLAVDLIILLLLYQGLQTLLGRSLNKQSAPIFIKNIASSINTVLLLICLTTIQFYSKMPSYLSSNWSESINNATNKTNSLCPLTNKLAQAQAAKSAIGWWLILSTTAQSRNWYLKIGAWLIFLLSSSLSLWAYSRYMSEIIYFSVG